MSGDCERSVTWTTADVIKVFGPVSSVSIFTLATSSRTDTTTTASSSRGKSWIVNQGTLQAMRLTAIGALIPGEAATQLEKFYIQSGVSKVEQALVVVLQVTSLLVAVGWMIAAKRWHLLTCESELSFEQNRRASLSAGAKMLQENLDWTKTELSWMLWSCVGCAALEYFQLRKALMHSSERVGVVMRSSLRQAMAFGVIVRCYCVLASFWTVEARLKLLESELETFFPEKKFPRAACYESAKVRYSTLPKKEYAVVAAVVALRVLVYVPTLRKWAEKLKQVAASVDDDTASGAFSRLQLVPTNGGYSSDQLVAIKKALDSDLWCCLLNMAVGVATAARVWWFFKTHKTGWTHALIVTLLVSSWIVFGCVRQIAAVGALGADYYSKVEERFNGKTVKLFGNKATKWLVKAARATDSAIAKTLNKYNQLPCWCKSAIFVPVGVSVIALF